MVELNVVHYYGGFTLVFTVRTPGKVVMVGFVSYFYELMYYI
jgi:hypothetical protein